MGAHDAYAAVVVVVVVALQVVDVVTVVDDGDCVGDAKVVKWLRSENENGIGNESEIEFEIV